LVAAQQVVEAVIKNERAHAVEEVGDAMHNAALVEGEVVGVVHLAVMAERGEERGRRAGDVPHAKAVDDAVGLVEQVAEGAGAHARQVGNNLVGALVEPKEECHDVSCHLRVAVAVADEAFIDAAGKGVVVQHVADSGDSGHWWNKSKHES